MPDDNNGVDSWREWRKHVLIELERNHKAIEDMTKEIAMLKVKSGAWGAIAGMVPAGIAIVIALMSS